MTFGKEVPARDPGGAGTVQRVRDSVDFMRGRADRPLPVAELAARAGVSPSHFFTLFKRLTGRSPLDYFKRLRMRRACDLMESGEVSVREASVALGYDDPFYFSRVFKAVCGVAPSDYRALPDGEKRRVRRCGLDAPPEVNGRHSAPPLPSLAAPRTQPARRVSQPNPQPPTTRLTKFQNYCAA